MTCGCNSHNGFLTAKGLEETAQRKDSLCEVDDREMSLYLDKVGSVSGTSLEGITMEFHEELIDEQYRRFHGVQS